VFFFLIKVNIVCHTLYTYNRGQLQTLPTVDLVVHLQSWTIANTSNRGPCCTPTIVDNCKHFQPWTSLYTYNRGQSKHCNRGPCCTPTIMDNPNTFNRGPRCTPTIGDNPNTFNRGLRYPRVSGARTEGVSRMRYTCGLQM